MPYSKMTVSAASVTAHKLGILHEKHPAAPAKIKAVASPVAKI
jgi:hypothetical protein